MTDTKKDNPYDTLFRAAFGDPRTAKELTLLILPPAHTRQLAGAEVTVDPHPFVDPRAARGRTDLLLQFSWPEADSRRTAYVYMLYEHKSSPDPWVCLQLLRYMATLWYRLKADEEIHTAGRLPEILPIVLYHGAERWDGPGEFAQLVGSGDGASYMPNFTPVFINLAQIPDHRITGSLQAVLGLLALKHSRLQIQRPTAERLTELLHAAEANAETQPLADTVEWIYAGVKSRAEIDELVAAAARKGYHGVEVSYMTYAEELLQEGEQKGLEKGLERGLQEGSLQRSREVLARLLSRRFGLSEHERALVLACEDQDALDAALDEILDANSKEQVLSKLG